MFFLFSCEWCWKSDFVLSLQQWRCCSERAVPFSCNNKQAGRRKRRRKAGKLEEELGQSSASLPPPLLPPVMWLCLGLQCSVDLLVVAVGLIALATPKWGTSLWTNEMFWKCFTTLKGTVCTRLCLNLKKKTWQPLRAKLHVLVLNFSF